MPDIGDTTATAATLLDGDLLTSTIDFAENFDWFHIPVAPGVDYPINFAGIDGAPADPVLQFYDSSGSFLFAAGPDYGVGASEYYYLSSAPGTLYLAVSANGGKTGSYALS